ncbi:hypothetical protein QBC44DRAFT_368743 [Cladorrhinum sp. PSN332]|nr:hypothetical protein QBC44DRAFT_368743 [Cladorrhinum sp. PSN332]
MPPLLNNNTTAMAIENPTIASEDGSMSSQTSHASVTTIISLIVGVLVLGTALFRIGLMIHQHGKNHTLNMNTTQTTSPQSPDNSHRLPVIALPPRAYIWRAESSHFELAYRFTESVADGWKTMFELNDLLG